MVARALHALPQRGWQAALELRAAKKSGLALHAFDVDVEKFQELSEECFGVCGPGFIAAIQKCLARPWRLVSQRGVTCVKTQLISTAQQTQKQCNRREAAERPPRQQGFRIRCCPALNPLQAGSAGKGPPS